MSRPRLHEQLSNLFQSKDNQDFIRIFQHEDFETFLKSFDLKIPLKDIAQVFTHTSFAHEFQTSHQEQLEFLGDAVLQLILTDELYRRYPDEKEGRLSKLRSAIVNEKTLAQMALGLKLNELILVGKGEYQKNLFDQPVVLADTFEALLAQIYRFHGLDFTKELFLDWLGRFVPNAFDKDFLNDFDAKSKLQEQVLAKYKTLPRYSSESHGSEFEVSLWINEKLSAKGIFPSKKGGEKELASEVLKKGNI